MKESNKKNRTKNREVKEKKIIDVPHEGDINESSSNTMSTGGLTSNRYGRERRQTPHSKEFITGSDDDGQNV
jgi:hypothetical protein